MELQLNIVRVARLSSSFPALGKEVIILDIFLEILREALKGILREVCAYFFRKTVLEYKKTTPRRRKQKGGSQSK
ncbi:hypothetical protein PH210_23455 [Paenibacillus sp. BSR1-1]|uniref:hypothetical protein n=1 Tax=Paenibacillus sp. BSR1-1 TaxID=3020845 RepID=UPI0025B138CD|nr:hypothetical protein [Paenibacillus sp. BSR1-1]MDN3019133.1 hypothetical protein [Paenibacillus sp. BSR1-1]